MADRTVNINIKYNVDVSQVNQAAAASQRAQTATDNLSASAAKAGQGINQGFSTAGKSIEAMNIQLARLKTQIAVADPGKVKGLSDQYKVLKTQIEAATKSAFGLPKALNETQAATQKLSTGFGNLVTVAKVFIAAKIAKEAFDIGLQMATLKGNVEGVERAFQRAFPNDVKLLNDLREATHGAVTDFELMQRTLQATNLGVAVEQLPVLFEFAAARAQQTGESVDYLVDSIVRGIGRKSILVLDNLGLSATRLKEQFDGASLASQSVGDVTKAVADIAREELGKMGGYAETSATKVSQLKVSWEQLRITLAKKIESGGIIDFATKSIKFLEDIIKGNRILAQEAARTAGSVAAAQIIEGKAYDNAGKDQQKRQDILQQEINTRVELIGRANDNIKKLEEEREIVRDKNPYDSRIASINKLILTENTNKFTMASTILILKEYIKELQNLDKAGDGVEPSGIIQRKQKEIEDIQKRLEETNNSSDLGIGGKIVQELAIARAELADLTREFTEFKIEPFKIEIDDATKALNSFEAASARIEESMKNIQNFTPPAQTVAPKVTFWDELKDEFTDNWKDITSNAIDIQAGFINDALNAELDSLKRQMGALRNFYDEQQLLAGDNERAKKELRIKEERDITALQKKIFEKEKQTRRAQALIDGAAAIIKTFVYYGFTPAGIIAAAGQAAVTVAQLAVINRQKSGYAKGVIDLKGPGTTTSDSIPANLSRGESVMTAHETQNSKGILKAIRNRQIDDRILKNLHVSKEGVHYQEMNDERIVDAIKSIPQTDYMKHMNTLLKVETSRDRLHKKIKRKSMNN